MSSYSVGKVVQTSGLFDPWI